MKGPVNVGDSSSQQRSSGNIDHEYPNGVAQFCGNASESTSETCGECDMGQLEDHLVSLDSPDRASPNIRPRWTQRQWRIIVVLLSATLTSSLAVCLFPPFFPRLAEEKGFSATVYGFVIGTHCLTSFIVTPMIGKNLPKYGVKYSFVSGTFIGSICVAVSGLLQFDPPGWEFVVTAVFIRIAHASVILIFLLKT